MLKNIVSFSADVTPECFATQMFANTNNNGELWLMDWYDMECEDCLTYRDFAVKLQWTQKDLSWLIIEYRNLLSHLEIIAQQYHKLDGTKETATNCLPNEQIVQTYCTYIMPIFANTQKEVVGEVETRVGKGLCNYEMMGHIRRLCKLLVLGANDLVLYNEGRHVMASMALFQFGIQKEEIADPIPPEIRDLRCEWVSLLHRAEEGEPFDLAAFRSAYEKTVGVFNPYCTQPTIPKNLLPVLCFAHRFGLKESLRGGKIQQTAQRLTMELIGCFSFGNNGLEQGTTVDKKGNVIPLPFPVFEEAMEIAERLL